MNRKTLFLLSCTCCLLISCLQEELFRKPDGKEWFNYTDARMTPIVSTMRAIEFQHPFMDEFCSTYGAPLWDKTDITIDSDREAVYFWVPLYKEGTRKEIETLWFFEMKDNMLNYGPVSRNAELIRKYGQDAQFDFLSFQVFGKDNSTKIIFKSPSKVGEYITLSYNCRDAYAGVYKPDGTEDLEYKGTTCQEVKVWVDYIDMTLIDNENGGGPAGGSGSNVSVTGNGIDDIAPTADSIFTHPAMNAHNWKTLEKMLRKIIDNCMGEMLYKELTSALKGSKIGVKFRNDKDAGYNSAANQISLPIGRIESNVLLHELFHVLQYKSQTKEEYDKSYLNNEIEAHYAQYFYLKKLPEYKDSKWEDGILHSKRGNAMMNLEELIIEEIPEKPLMLETFIKYTVKPVFQKVQAYKGYSFDESKEGMESLSLFMKLSENCNKTIKNNTP